MMIVKTQDLLEQNSVVVDQATAGSLDELLQQEETLRAAMCWTTDSITLSIVCIIANQESRERSSIIRLTHSEGCWICICSMQTEGTTNELLHEAKLCVHKAGMTITSLSTGPGLIINHHLQYVVPPLHGWRSPSCWLLVAPIDDCERWLFTTIKPRWHSHSSHNFLSINRFWCLLVWSYTLSHHESPCLLAAVAFPLHLSIVTRPLKPSAPRQFHYNRYWSSTWSSIIYEQTNNHHQPSMATKSPPSWNVLDNH